jgi:uncharacterized membrane protein
LGGKGGRRPGEDAVFSGAKRRMSGLRIWHIHVHQITDRRARRREKQKFSPVSLIFSISDFLCVFVVDGFRLSPLTPATPT